MQRPAVELRGGGHDALVAAICGAVLPDAAVEAQRSGMTLEQVEQIIVSEREAA